MYFTAPTFYFRITVLLRLPATNWLVYTLGEHVALCSSLMCPPKFPLCATG